MIVSIQPSKKKLFPSIAVYIVALLAVIGGVFYLIAVNGGFGGKTGLSAEVYLGDKLLGTTPFETEELSPGEREVVIKNDGRQYKTTAKFVSGTQVAVNRDLGTSDIFSSGQNFWMEKDGSDLVLSIVSDPSNATVYIDNTKVGETPYSASNLSEGEYEVRVEYPGYETQSARVSIKRGFKLNVSVDLFPLPVPPTVEVFEGSDNLPAQAGLYNVFSDNLLVTADTKGWVDAVLYWNKTRGINLSGLGVNKEPVFDYFLDYKGNVYMADGTLLSGPSEYSKLAEATKGAYLGRVSDGSGLTQEASEVYKALSEGVVVGGKQVKIKDTGLGWLRVRSSPGLDGTEIGKATVGETYPVLEEGTGWVKIKVSDTVSGWVSSSYVELLE